jgi:hypothetical protein
MSGLEDEISATPAPQAPALAPPRPPQRVAANAPTFADNANLQPPPAAV